jgi:hypothetical protein
MTINCGLCPKEEVVEMWVRFGERSREAEDTGETEHKFM